MFGVLVGILDGVLVSNPKGYMEGGLLLGLDAGPLVCGCVKYFVGSFVAVC
jgi:hypothetical protein